MMMIVAGSWERVYEERWKKATKEGTKEGSQRDNSRLVMIDIGTVSYLMLGKRGNEATSSENVAGKRKRQSHTIIFYNGGREPEGTVKKQKGVCV